VPPTICAPAEGLPRRIALRLTLALLAIVMLLTLLSPPAAHASAYSDMVRADGPNVFWQLDDSAGSTSVADSSPAGGNDGTVWGAGSPAFSQPGLVNDGGTSVAIGSGSGTQALTRTYTLNGPTYTVELWLKPTVLGSAVLMNHHGGGGLAWYSGGFWISLDGGGSLVFQSLPTQYDSRTVTSSSTLSVGNTYHLVFVWNGTTGQQSIYINGVLDNSSSSSSASGMFSPSGASLNLGNYPYYPYLQLHSTVDDVAVYPSALTAAQIAHHYDIGVNGGGAQAPSNNTLPTITGRPVASTTQTGTRGTWSDATDATWGYAWFDCDTAGNNCSAITGASSLNYTPTTSDIGKTLLLSVTATNAIGSHTAVSVATGVIMAPNPYHSVVLADHPVAYYPLGDGVDSTVLHDAGPLGIDGHVVTNGGETGPTLGTSSALTNDTGNSTAFGGNSIGVVDGDARLVAPHTLALEVWVNTTSVDSQSGVNTVIASDQATIRFLPHDNVENSNGYGTHWVTRDAFSASIAGGTTVTSAPGIDGDHWGWHYVAVTVTPNPDGSYEQTLYFDGQPVAKAQIGAITVPSTQSLHWANDPLSGWGGGRPPYAFGGPFENIAWYNAGLTAGQVLNHYTTGRLGWATTHPSFYGPDLNNVSSHAGDPVSVVTGNVYDSHEDLHLKGVGLDLAVSRFYNSQDDTPGVTRPFGPGWTWTYNSSLSATSDGSVVTQEPQGARRYFANNGDGSYASPPGDRDVLTKNTDGTYTLTRPSGVAWNYNASGQLASVKDLNANTISFSYTSGRLHTLTDTQGRVTTLTYDDAGRITLIEDSTGRQLHYAYDSSTGDLLTETDPTGAVTTYTYDSAHRMLTRKLPADTGHPSSTFKWTYDDQGRAVSSGWANDDQKVTYSYADDGTHTTLTDVNGGHTVYTYDGNGEITSIFAPGESTGLTYTYDPVTLQKASVTDPLGHETTMSYDAQGRLTTLTRPAPTTGGDPRVTTTTYGVYDEVLTSTDPLGHTTTRTYDTHGNPLTSTDANGHETTLTFNTRGQPLTSTDPRGKTTTYAYDDAGNLETVTDPLGNASTLSFDGLGRLSSVTDPLGRVTSYAYDAADHLTQTTLPSLASGQDPPVVTLAYDPRGNLITTTDPNGHASTASVNGEGQITGMTDATGRATTYSYDSIGNRTSATDAAGHVTTFAYDALQKLTSVTRPDGTTDGSTSSIAYNTDGSTASTTDANGHATTYAYDNAGRLTSVTDPAGGTASYTYDPTGRVLTQTDPNGHETTLTYDAVGNTLTKTDPLSHVTTLTYDAANNLATAVDPNGVTTTLTRDDTGRPTGIGYSDGTTHSVSQGYDAAGQLASVTDGTGTTSLHYDGAGNLTEKDLPGSRTLSYAYDPAGELASTTLPGDSAPITYTYDDAGRLATLTDQNSHATTYAYDARGLLSQVAYPESNTGENLTRDAQGRITQVNDVGGPTTPLASYAYTYDKAGNVTQVDEAASESAALTYDSLNRLTRENWTGPTATDRTYTYDVAGNRLTSVIDGTTTSYTYDAGGEMQSAGAATYGYDSNGDQTTKTVGESTTSYGYDAAGNQTSAGGATYGYDAAGERVSTTAADGATTSSVYDAGQVAQQTVTPSGGSAATSDYVRDPAGALVQTMAQGSSTPEYYLHDGQGSVVALTDGTSGTTQATYSYGAFGQSLGETGSSPQPFGYLGNASDATGGLNNFNAREYDPANGRFQSRDPIGAAVEAPQTMNPYAYGTNNPLTQADPSGLATPKQQASPEMVIACYETENCALTSYGPTQVSPGAGTGDAGFWSNEGTSVTAFWDGFSLGLIPLARGAAGLNGNLDTSSAVYRGGHFIGDVDGTAFSGVLAGGAAERLALKYGVKEALSYRVVGGFSAGVASALVKDRTHVTAGSIGQHAIAGEGGGIAAYEAARAGASPTTASAVGEFVAELVGAV
jgi:RHS repeat-associated protein